MKHIERLHSIIEKNLFCLDPVMDYARLTKTITRLANVLADTDTDESVWSIGEYSPCCLSDLIVGAYWHYTEWHSGQFSDGYAALSALGRVFSPNMSGSEPENEAYLALADIA